eukprot:14927656-Alexandrium_andersonii.AAC.1
MSASLVGSEMCIRDRPQEGPSTLRYHMRCRAKLAQAQRHTPPLQAAPQYAAIARAQARTRVGKPARP